MPIWNKDERMVRTLAIAAKSSDAYSADAWGTILWVQATEMLVDMGFSDGEVEYVLRSKMTRWARDQANDKPSLYLACLVEQVKSHIEFHGSLKME